MHKVPIVSVEQPGWVHERSSDPAMAVTIPRRRGSETPRSVDLDVVERRVGRGQLRVESFERVEQDLGDREVS
jgi:hypothetical protein